MSDKMIQNADSVSPHPWRPIFLPVDNPLMICRVCGRWWDDQIHAPAQIDRSGAGS